MAREPNEMMVNRIGTVLHTDSSPLDAPKGTHTYALNAVVETTDGEQSKISNEKSNVDIANLGAGFFPIGDRYISNDDTVIISINPTTGYEEIGIIDKASVYTPIVNTNVLDLSISYQADIIFRLRRGNERIIYWTDGLNGARSFNIDRPHNYHNDTYKNYLRSGGNPLTFTGEKWDASSFDLIRTYKSIPSFADVKVVETGSILPGSYNFAIQYVDDDLNPTEWISTSNIVRIYNDTVTNSYERIRGSKNINTTAQQFDRADKSIKLTITNLDTNFPYYRMAIIRASSLDGSPEKVLASELYSTSDSNFTYTGNDSQLTEVALGDIIIGGDRIYAPKHIEQIENSLILADGRGKGINWCDFQKYASKITSDLTTKDIILNNVLSEANPKNPKSTFLFRGYMPGEVYSFGVCYIFSDGYVSPAFHIPGMSSVNTNSKMKLYEGDSKYLDIHNCSVDNYWGKDFNGNTLVGKKQRHHRFPFRKDVNKPLVTSSTTTNNINKHRLKVVITLASGKTYPVTSGNPIPIDYIFNYQITGTSATIGFSGILTDTDLGKVLVIYDDISLLDDITTGVKGQLDAGSQLATTYMVSGNENFVITFTYETYVASTSFNNDTSEIFGIEFSNIEKPHPDVVGFYIVRNDRSDDDRIVVDNAVFGPMTSFGQYKSFGLVTPKQYYTASNCGRTGNSGKTLSYYDKGVWFFNPEFQFFNKKTDFDKVEIEGLYTQSSVNMPTISDAQGFACNGGFSNSGRDDLGGTKGVYVSDVQAGTSFNPDVNKAKDKDDDGFDLNIGYRNTNFTYAVDNVTVLPTKKNVLYLNAASYQNYNNNTYYNVSVDNKIGQYITDDVLGTSASNHLKNGTTAGLQYGALIRDNTNAYTNFITRPYYKEHNNPIYFGSRTIVDNFKVFNGDAEISGLHIVSSVFYDIVVADRAKKSGVWKIIFGAILVIASVAAAILTAGATLPLLALAISYGTSLISSGIKFEQFKSMIDVDYEKGLKDTVVDGGVYECIRDTIGRFDDTIRWFCDRASNIYIESSVPFALRAGLTCGVSDFMDAPAVYNEEAFRSYITEKLTAIDRNQGAGRIYKGYATAEYYDVNKDYLRFNREKLFVHLPIEYDCCSDKNEIFPTRWWWSQQSFQEEKIDNYRVFLPNNYRDIEGEHGEISDLYRFGNNLFILTKEALWQVPQNNQERVTGEVVSFIGTGSLFSIPPKPVLDDNLSSGGTQHKWSTIKTKYGVLFVSELESRVYFHSDGLKDISQGNRNLFKEIFQPYLNSPIFKKFGLDLLHNDCPANPHGVGYHTGYDTRYNRILITKIDYNIIESQLSTLIAVQSIPTSGTAFSYCKDNGLFYKGTIALDFDNVTYFENKSFTLSYSIDEKGFTSYHSYLPNKYISSQNSFYTSSKDSNAIRKHHREGNFHTFNGKYSPFIIEYISVRDAINSDMIEDITILTRARKWDSATKQYIDNNTVTFNKLVAYNSKQSTGELIIRAKEALLNQNTWYDNQIREQIGVILATKDKRDWNINDLRDYVIDYDKSLFTKEWPLIRNQYPIDKVVNPAAVSFNKNWQELQSLDDKYVIIRLKFDNFSDINLIFDSSISTQPLSNG